MSATLTIELPVDGLPSAAERPANFPDELRFLLAVKLFEQGRISSGNGDLGLYFGHPERLALVAPIKREIDGGFELDWDLRGYGKEIWLNRNYSGTSLSYTKSIGRPMGCVYRRYRKNGLVHAEFECKGDEPTARQGSLDLPSPMDGASMSRHYKKYSNATVESCRTGGPWMTGFTDKYGWMINEKSASSDAVERIVLFSAGACRDNVLRGSTCEIAE